jgi:hypothetical protein
MATLTATSAPRRVESSLLVVADFRDQDGDEWRVGDRAPLARAAVREAARERPELFAVEFSTEPFDPEAGWFRQIDAKYEQEYERLKALRGGAEERRQQALRDELAAQNSPDSSQRQLERRYRKQEEELAKRQEQLKEARQRRRIESEMQFAPGGFHHDR